MWQNGRRVLHHLVDLLCVAQRPPSTTSLGRFTLWHNGRPAKQPGFIDACTRRSRTYFPKTVTNHAEKYEGLIQRKILLRVLNALEELLTNTSICTLYEDNTKDERRGYMNHHVS